MNNLRTAAQQALEALEYGQHSLKQVSEHEWVSRGELAMQALRAALAEPVQEQEQAEPVAWMDRYGDIYKMPEIENWQDLGWTPSHTMLYAAPPRRKPLTDEQDRALCEAYFNDASDEYFKARPELDFPEMRRIFYAGHRKAWISYEAAHGIGEE